MNEGRGETPSLYFMTQKLLYETASGCVYLWTKELSETPGFVPYERKPKAAPAPEPVVEPVTEQVTAEPDIKEMAAAVLKRKKK